MERMKMSKKVDIKYDNVGYCPKCGNVCRKSEEFKDGNYYSTFYIDCEKCDFKSKVTVLKRLPKQRNDY